MLKDEIKKKNKKKKLKSAELTHNLDHEFRTTSQEIN
jgi:hypothetical protein